MRETFYMKKEKLGNLFVKSKIQLEHFMPEVSGPLSKSKCVLHFQSQ